MDLRPDGLLIPLGLDKHLVPEIDLGVDISPLEPAVSLGLDGSREREWSHFQRILSEVNSLFGVEVEEVVRVVGLEEGESSEKFDFGVSDFFSEIDVHGGTLL